MRRRVGGPLVEVLTGVWRNDGLRQVELAYAAFNIAELGTWLAMLVYAYARGGATEAGVLATGLLVPAAVLAPVLAAAAERRPPGQALIYGYVGQAVGCAAVGVAMLAHADRFAVYALLLMPALAYTATRPVQAAFAPALARRPEELVATNVVSGWIESIGALFGPLLVGIVLTVGSPGIAFLAGAGLAVTGVALVMPWRDVVTAPAEAASTFSLGESIGFVRRDANARMLVFMLGAECVAIGALDILYVQLARGVLHRGGSWAGYLNAAFGVGSLLAIVVTARLVGRPRLAVPLALSAAVWTLALFGLAAAPEVAAALALLAVAGGSRAAFDLTGRILLQRVARPDLLARVFGLLEGLEMAAFAAGALLAPALIALGGTAAAFVGVAAILPLVTLATGRRLLDIDRHATVPVVEIALLRSLPIFAPLPPPMMEAVAGGLTALDVPAGVDLITQGEPGDRFYAIADGEVDVIADGALVTTLGRGQGFGEIALLYGVPRTATVRTRSPSRLYALERDDFVMPLTGHPSSHAAVQSLAQRRLEELHALRST